MTGEIRKPATIEGILGCTPDDDDVKAFLDALQKIADGKLKSKVREEWS